MGRSISFAIKMRVEIDDAIPMICLDPLIRNRSHVPLLAHPATRALGKSRQACFIIFTPLPRWAIAVDSLVRPVTYETLLVDLPP